MRANEDMMPKLSICHGHRSKMNFSVSDYIRGDTAYLLLNHLCIGHADGIDKCRAKGESFQKQFRGLIQK